MTENAPVQTLPQETVEHLKVIFQKIFTEGRHWIQSIATTDWRRTHYVNSRAARRQPKGSPSIAQVAIDSRIILDYMTKVASSETEGTHHYLIVKPDNGCLKEGGIALLRPVLKYNKDNKPQLNFHVWFHCMPGANENDHLMAGWRLEGPEGNLTTHNFFHAQPLRKYGIEGKGHGMPDRFPERFPTIPVPATNIMELCLTAILVACGKDALHSLARHSGNREIRDAAQAFHDKIIGANEDPSTPSSSTSKK